MLSETSLRKHMFRYDHCVIVGVHLACGVMQFELYVRCLDRKNPEFDKRPLVVVAQDAVFLS